MRQWKSKIGVPPRHEDSRPAHSTAISQRAPPFQGRYRRAVGPIEVTALLNVMMLVGMFLFLASRFVVQPGIRIHLPVAEFQDGIPYGARVLTLAHGGLIFFNDERLELPQLAAAFSSVEDSAPLLIEADETTPYSTLVEVYSLAVKAGIREVLLATRPPSVEP